MKFEPLKDLSNTGARTGFCGGFTHALEYLDGPLKDKAIKLDEVYSYKEIIEGELSSYEGTLDSFDWIGTHVIRIKGTLGRRYMYNSIYSNDLVVTIVNPCETSTVNDNGKLRLEDMLVPRGSGFLEFAYDGPRNSASFDYGNGYNKCGDLEYTFLD